MAKVKDENHRYIDSLKRKYDAELSEYRSSNEQVKLKIALDINEKTLSFIKERHNAYY